MNEAGIQRSESGMPSPVDRFGFAPGADRRLIRWPAMLAYFRDLAACSDRLAIDEIGHGWRDQPLVLLTISAPENLRRLDGLRAIQARLADPRRLPGEERDRLLAEGRTVCLVTCSIHASEVGGVQMTPTLVHELVTRDDEEVRRILHEVVFLLVPSLNPGGMELVAEWYERTLGSPWEGSVPPELYHPNAGHDLNRDWFMLTQPETRLVVERVHNRWWPHIVFDLHQMQANGPRYVVPPFIDPYDPNVDPLLQAQINAIGTAIAAELIAEGKTGVATSIIFDAYSPSRAYQHYHGGVRILSEAASPRLATPIRLEPEGLAETRGFQPRVSSHNHPVPWTGGEWRLADVVAYNRSAILAVLNHAARYRDRWVRNFLTIQRRGIEQADPGGFLILPPACQRDPGTAAELVEVLRLGRVEIGEATEAFQADGVAYEAGTIVVPFAQPFGRYAKTLLEVQHYPVPPPQPGGASRFPYDITAHTLPLQMGVEAVRVADLSGVPTRPVETMPALTGGLSGPRSSAAWWFSATTNASAALANRLLAAGAVVARLRTTHEGDGEAVAQGSFVVTDVDADWLDRLGRTSGVALRGLPAARVLDVAELRPPRIGLYRSWKPNAIDEGWTRFVLGQFAFAAQTLRDREIRQGGLRDRFDVLVLPHQPPRDIIEGNSFQEYPPEFAGGLGELGLTNLVRFVDEGGTLVALDGAAEVAVRALGLPLVNVVEHARPESFSAPGTLLRILVDGQHPIGWGFEREAAAMFVSSPAFDVRPTFGADVRVVASYPLAGQLLSGWLLGGEHLAGRAAIVEARVGRGRVVLIGFRCQFRAQARGTYRFLFNALYRSTMAD